MENILKEWNEVSKMKIFEISVITPKNEKSYIIFDIDIENNEFIASHEGLNDEENNSDKIAFVSTIIDPDFSLTVNLENLYTECINKLIINNYELTD